MNKMSDHNEVIDSSWALHTFNFLEWLDRRIVMFMKVIGNY